MPGVVKQARQALSGDRRSRRGRSGPGPAAGVGVVHTQKRDAPGLVTQRGGAAHDGDRGGRTIDANGSGDASHCHGRQHGDRQHRQALRGDWVAQQLAGQLTQGEEADSHQHADNAGTRTAAHPSSISR
jgi:hypothetical protein